MEGGFFYFNDVASNPVVQARIAQQRQLRLQIRDPNALQHVRTNSNSEQTSPLRTLSPTNSKQLGEIYAAAAAVTAMESSYQGHATRGSVSGSSTASSREHEADLLNNPYEIRHGRRYLRDMPYALPCDLAEMHRQSLRTLLGVTVFGKAACAPSVATTAPKKVLEIGCGSGYWSSSCHDYFASLGYRNVSFTGVDIAPVTPDLNKQKLKWTFVQHDLRKMPWPFNDEEFDYVMIKDMSLAVPVSASLQRFMEENIRVLKEGGTLEVWESDHVLRCILPHPPPPAGPDQYEEDMARDTRTFRISPATPFGPAQNKLIADSNAWIETALAKRNLPPTPCALVAETLFQEPDRLCDVGYRRVAIPLRDLPWERDQLDGRKHSRSGTGGKSTSARSRGKPNDGSLTADQAAIRSTALLTVLQKIESFEPVLKETSGKNTEEWANWWASMMANFFEQEGPPSGECLEIGAWWATKRTR